MNNEQLHNLKQQVIEAFVRHCNGEELLFSDKVYDEKLSRIKEVDPNFNIYDFQPNYEGLEYIPHRSGMEDLAKEHVHDIADRWNIWDEHEVRLPKWDGSSLVVYYTRGNLVRILSMRDKDTGIDQTEKFKDFVPAKINDKISYFRCECLVDTRLDENPRGKANGLVNSKYLEEEIEDKATLVAFCCHGLSGEKLDFQVLKDSLKGKELIRENGIPKFIVSPECHELTLDRGIAMYESSVMNFKFAVDGIVYYNDHSADKYDYIDSAITEVIGINWAETDKEGWFPTVSVDPVELDGATISNPSSNGVPNMIRMGIGVGAKVEIIRSGLTIPKIVNTIIPVEVTLPKCPHCGYQMTPDDLYGSTLKCGNEDCAGKYDNRYGWLAGWLEGMSLAEVQKYFEEHLDEIFFEWLNVARFNHEAKRQFPQEDVRARMLADIKTTGDYESLRTYIGEAYSWSDLQWDECWLNFKSTFKVLNDVLNRK